jgi:hypothetical protein
LLNASSPVDPLHSGRHRRRNECADHRTGQDLASIAAAVEQLTASVAEISRQVATTAAVARIDRALDIFGARAAAM